MKKQFTTVELIVWALFISIMVGGTIWLMKTPAKTVEECTAEYVKVAGQDDCENKMKANEAESDAYNESLDR